MAGWRGKVQQEEKSNRRRSPARGEVRAEKKSVRKRSPRINECDPSSPTDSEKD